MQCPYCGLDNLPTSIRCYDCGYLFNPEQTYLALTDDSNKNPGWFHEILQRLPLPSAVVDGDFQSVLERALILPFLWVPGMALWAMDHYEKGLALLILTVIPLLLGFTLFNHGISNILLPLGMLIYLWSLIDGFYTWRERHYPVVPSLSPRIKAMGFFIGSFIVLFIVWAPELNVMPVSQSTFKPVIEKGDFVFLNQQPSLNRTYQRTDLVAIHYSNQTTFGRIIAFPNETIYMDKEHFYSNGQRLDPGLNILTSNGTNRRIEIPPNSYLVAMNVAGENLLQYNQAEIVPAYTVLGRVEAVINPAQHRKRLK